MRGDTAAPLHDCAAKCLRSGTPLLHDKDILYAKTYP